MLRHQKYDISPAPFTWLRFNNRKIQHIPVVNPEYDKIDFLNFELKSHFSESHFQRSLNSITARKPESIINFCNHVKLKLSFFSQSRLYVASIQKHMVLLRKSFIDGNFPTLDLYCQILDNINLAIKKPKLKILLHHMDAK